MQEVHFIEKAEEAAEILRPVRIEILSRLSTPKTCPELARELGLTTQKINYHMKVLKEAGLVTLVDERRKRGTVEGVYRAVAKSFWFSPHIVTQMKDRARVRDQASLSYLLRLAEDLQIDIGHLMERSNEISTPSLGVDARIELRDEKQRSEFLKDVKEIFSQLARKYGATSKADTLETDKDCNYRLMLACYAPNEEANSNNQ